MRDLRVSIRRDTRGAALLETVIVVPVLVLFMVGIIDISSVVIQYGTFSQAAHEGVKTLSGRGNLGTTSSCDSSQETCTSQVRSKRNHGFTHDRIRYLLWQYQQEYNISFADEPVIRSFYFDDSEAAEPDSVRIEIRARITGVFGNYPIEVSEQGAYLF